MRQLDEDEPGTVGVDERTERDERGEDGERRERDGRSQRAASKPSFARRKYAKPAAKRSSATENV